MIARDLFHQFPQSFDRVRQNDQLENLQDSGVDDRVTISADVLEPTTRSFVLTAVE